MLDEKEKTELTNAVSLVVSTQIATINGHLEAIKTELSYIKEKGDKTLNQAEKTNGRVNKHDTDLEVIRLYFENRSMTCPQKKDIDTILTDRKNWKQKLLYDVAVLFLVCVAGYVSVISAGAMFKSDLKKAETEIKSESKKDDKIQDLKINNNTKARKDSEVNKAFDESLKENNGNK